MRIISIKERDALFEAAYSSDRKRSHLLLHSGHHEKVQRLLIGFIKGSYVEPHYHKSSTQWEMFIVMEGCVEIKTYEYDGSTKSIFLAGPQTETTLVEFAPGEIHSVECISDRALMLEIKEGPFDPQNAKVPAPWLK